MTKQKKNNFLIPLILIGAILVIFIITYMSEMEIKNLEKEQIKILSEKEEEIENLKNELEFLKEENKNLSENLETLKSKKGETVASGQTYNQAMKILSDIYLLIESGDAERAKRELNKFDTSTFDDTIISYKKALLKLTE